MTLLENELVRPTTEILLDLDYLPDDRNVKTLLNDCMAITCPCKRCQEENPTEGELVCPTTDILT